ncbi:MAG: imidazoleglycerol-phosphate dehydratase, partial [Gammaproteobacteria bacterium]|nr:imidazoleglycerol-phosphate dehydratase [Gammaproteobacteria bacterium]
MAERKATVKRDTLETQIEISIDLDGSGKGRFDTGVPFLEHMLDQVARHG